MLHPDYADKKTPDAPATPADSSLRDRVRQMAEEHPEQSGFHLLTTGGAAFSARRAVIQSSQKTLDLQYYILQDDLTGKILLEEILRAADRGVSVRMLLDELDFSASRETICILDRHENIEIRVFNPPLSLRKRWAYCLARWVHILECYTRRMHNKALIGDGYLAVMGGRNMGDEYFDARAEFAFNDLDVLAMGPVVESMQNCFDTYWNARASYPLEKLNMTPPTPRKAQLLRLTLQKYYDSVADMRVISRQHPQEIIKALHDGSLPLVWGEAKLAQDSPDKVFQTNGKVESPPMNQLEHMLENAQYEFVAVSPYFIPGERWMRVFTRATQRGVQLRTLTNSLASTDISAAHAVYCRYRSDLLEMGAEMYELKPICGKRTRSNLWRRLSSRSSLHAKVYVLDRQWVAVGSMNLDPRSRFHNTESMIFIRSPDMAEQVLKMFDNITRPATSYRVELADKHQRALAWRHEEQGDRHRQLKEPHPGWFRRLANGVFYHIAPENRL